MKVSILAMEVCARMDDVTDLHARLRARTAGLLPTATNHEKWEFYSECALDLVAHVGTIERGCWDFFDDDTRARRDFKMWKDGMDTREGVRDAPLAAATAYRDPRRYMTFTMAFLLVNGSSTERQLANTCDVMDSVLWDRATFARILRAMTTMSFASVHSDVAYLIPRDTDWALTSDDLADEKFEYLRMVTG